MIIPITISVPVQQERGDIAAAPVQAVVKAAEAVAVERLRVVIRIAAAEDHFRGETGVSICFSKINLQMWWNGKSSAMI